MMKGRYRAQSEIAQERRREKRACTAKAAYASLEQARQQGNDVYRCKRCGLWHRTGQVAALAARLGARGRRISKRRAL